MCARFTLKSSAVVLQDLFELDEVPELAPRYNIAPAQFVPAIVRSESGRELRFFKWGLVPSWAKDPAIGQNLINAKAETAAEKPSFRSAFKRRRCLLAADGFYEWREEEPPAEGSLFSDEAPPPKSGRPLKQPYYLSLQSGAPFGIAGLYEYWESPEGVPIESCTLLTTEPNELVAQYHNRMPVILPPVRHALWLDPETPSDALLEAILEPFPASGMRAHPVTRRMSNPRFEDPSAVVPLSA
jgi:putative SOS response-associated peptidase YedK